MNWKELYKKCNTNKYARILSIDNKVKLNSNIKNLFKEQWLLIVFLLITILALFTIIFIKTPINILYSFLFILMLFIFLIYNNTYKLILGNNKLELIYGIQKTIINYEDLGNIYIDRQKMFFMGFPVYIYSLNIIYSNNGLTLSTSLPTIMLSKKEILRFFTILHTEELKKQKHYEVERKKIENRKTKINYIFIIIISLLIISSLFFRK